MTTEFLPVLPLRAAVLYPHVAMPFAIGRPGSLAAARAAIEGEDKALLAVTQRDPDADPESSEELYPVGVRAILRRVHDKDDEMSVIAQGVERLELDHVERDAQTGMLRARFHPRPFDRDQGAAVDALRDAILEKVSRVLELMPNADAGELGRVLNAENDTATVMYMVASLLASDPAKAHELLAKDSLLAGLQWLHEHLSYEIDVMEVRRKIADDAASDMNAEQREFILRRQLEKIREELGEESPEKAELAELRERIDEADLPDRVANEAARQLQRLERLPTAAVEYQVVQSYLELLLDLPWNIATEQDVDVVRARRVLDEDHYALEDVKERIIEHLGVLQLNPRAKSPILCLIGAPGVGKTSLGQSIARALGREFARMSLGGLHDEAELRGHRRTYVGAMPGRILNAIKRAGVNNPVLMLDEIDKLGRDFRGDPASALLEILDPEQNREFHDNYLDLPFDLSKVLFITTANAHATIPAPLLDRMEVVRLPGYTAEEKLQIAKRYLLPRQLEQSGLDADRCRITDAVLEHVIQQFTREAGVRHLERNIGRLTRKVALRFAEGATKAVILTVDQVSELLGPPPFFPEEVRRELPPGVAPGLAWTEAGGAVIYVEAAHLPQRKELTLTGQLGDIMQESARAAETCVWARTDALGIGPKTKGGAHIHVPSGAIPKDGPSAGITMATALASLFTNRPIRADTAMTGEITITGLVLPVGGIKEKLLAARRVGLTRVILPKANEKDLTEVNEETLTGLELHLAERVEDVWELAMPAFAHEEPARAVG